MMQFPMRKDTILFQDSTPFSQVIKSGFTMEAFYILEKYWATSEMD
jgi:hypothetical protein